jgi:hypothetical protein
MIPKLQVFTNCDFEPWAVFYFGTEGYGLTKEKAIEEYKTTYDSGWMGYDEPFNYDVTEPHLFYIFEDIEDEEGLYEEGYNWQECDASHPKAVACFGVKFR